MILHDIERGAYLDPSDFAEQAVAMLHDQEERFRANRSDISAALKVGYESAQQGDLLDGDQVRITMSARKSGWLAQPHG